MTAISTLGMNPTRRRIEEAGFLYQRELAHQAAQSRRDAERQAAAEKEAAEAVFKTAAAKVAPLSRPTQIVRDVAEKHGLTPEQIIGPSRAMVAILARHEAMWKVRKATRLSLPQIGRHFGGRDHTTALNGIRKHEQRLKGAMPRRDLIDLVAAAIAAAPEGGVRSEELRDIVRASNSPPTDVARVLRTVLDQIRFDLGLRSFRLVSVRPGNGWAFYRIEAVPSRLDAQAAAMGGAS